MRYRNTPTGAVAAVLMLASICGCGSGGSSTHHQAQPTPAAATSTSPETTHTGPEPTTTDPTTTQDDPAGATTRPAAPPEKSSVPGIPPYTQALVTAQAVAFMQAYARPSKANEPYWWAELAPLISPADLHKFNTINPAKVPFSTVQHQSAQLHKGPAAGPYKVTLRTDHGAWNVTLISASDARFLIIDARPQQTAHRKKPAHRHHSKSHHGKS